MAECWSCGAERGVDSSCPVCGKIQPPPRSASHFDVLGLQKTMRLDRAALEGAYRDRSRKVHPDRFARASSIERRLALEHTTVLNDAYRTLRDPQRRAEYLMNLEGVEIGREEARTSDPRFLTEMLELQEVLETERNVEMLQKLRDRIAGRLAGRIEALERYFDARIGTKDESVDALQELRYLRRLLERIDLKLEEVG